MKVELPGGRWCELRDVMEVTEGDQAAMRDRMEPERGWKEHHLAAALLIVNTDREQAGLDAVRSMPSPCYAALRRRKAFKDALLLLYPGDFEESEDPEAPAGGAASS